jgi:putative redox protein
MSQTTITYEGKLHSTGRFEGSGVIVPFDVAVEKGGTGLAPTPTDYLSAALGGCLLATMGMLAARRGWDIAGTTAMVEKEYVETKPLRIKRLATTIRIPDAARFSAEERAILERAPQHCTVHHSLHPDIDAPIVFVWNE